MELGKTESNCRPRVAELIRNATGGMKEHYIALTEGLIDSGIDVVALCNFSLMDKEKLTKVGAKVIPFEIGDSINPIRDIISILRLSNLLRKYGIDILHCHGFRAGIIGRLAALMARCDCIYTIHNFLPLDFGGGKRKIVALVEQKLSHITKYIITVSEALKKEVNEVLGVSSDRIRVIYNGISLPNVIDIEEDVREKWGIGREDKLIGTVARLIPSKGIDVLLDAIPHVIREEPNAKFMIVGEGPGEYELKRKVKELKCEKNIIFSGYCEYIWYYYKAFDIFVLPSLSEGLGISLLEAMAMGKPVIATSTGGIKEIIQDNKNGLLVPPGDSKELAKAILDYCSSPDLVNEYGKRAKEDVRERFRIESMIRKTAGIIFETENA